MKTEQLKELGLTEDQIKAVFAENGKDIAAEKAKYDTLKTDYEAVKTQLITANTTIDGFKDYDEIKGKVTQYQIDLAAAESKSAKILADIEFQKKIEAVALRHKPHDIKDVVSLLDIEALKASKNLDADIEAAFVEKKTSKPYLFPSEEPFHNPVLPTGNPAPKNKKMTIAEAMAYKNLHPEVDVKTLI